MGKFKVGDKVRCTKSWYDQFTEGKIYTVKSTRADGVQVEEDDSGRTTNGWLAEFFEPVTTKFKVGDRVNAISSVGDGEYAIVEVVYDDGSYGIRWNWSTGAKSSVHTWSESELAHDTEPAPLFAVGDKVRFKKGIKPHHNAPYTKNTLTVQHIHIDGDITVDGFTHKNGETYHQIVHIDDLEHATTDEEAVRPTINEIRNLYGYPPIGSSSTTGFTIPTDEEALPPKVSIGEYTANGIFKIDVGGPYHTYPFVFDGSKLFLSNAQTYKPRPAIVALVTNGQPLPSDKPKVHKTATKATKEADRLAVLHPGQEFGVFELVSKRVATVDIMEEA